jgi:uncharacterized membrane protein YgdD (TMEM256/DUF423 family)
MTPLSRRWIAIGAALGALGVAFGAFGAHSLPGLLENLGYAGDDLARRREIFETAVRYQTLHALAIVAVGIALEMRTSSYWRFAVWAFLIGVAIFSGLLKVLSVAGPQWNWLGAIVPFGGVAMIVGWIAVAIGALRKDDRRPVNSALP